jgi:hypothetical protein
VSWGFPVAILVTAPRNAFSPLISTCRQKVPVTPTFRYAVRGSRGRRGIWTGGALWYDFARGPVVPIGFSRGANQTAAAGGAMFPLPLSTRKSPLRSSSLMRILHCLRGAHDVAGSKWASMPVGFSRARSRRTCQSCKRLKSMNAAAMPPSVGRSTPARSASAKMVVRAGPTMPRNSTAASAVPGGAHADVADLDPRHQAGE